MLLRRLTTKPRGLLRDATLCASLILFQPNTMFAAIGGVLFALGAILHFWSKGCLVRNWEVTAVGPYRMVRHPFYLANFMIDMGICLFSGRWWLPIVYSIAFALVYIPTIRKEEAYLIERHGESYRRFAASIPALVPYRLWSLFAPLDFEWASILREKEISRIMRVLAIPLYFVIVAALFHQLPNNPSHKTTALVASIAVALLLHAGSTLVRSQERHARLGYISDHS